MNSLSQGATERRIKDPHAAAGLGEDPTLQDTINTRVYFAPVVTRSYRGKLLERAETIALLKYQQAFAGRSVLDVGIGTGRTADYLAPVARRYVAIDYSPAMVEHVGKTMPEIEVHLADMRDLSAWEAGSFDFVFATNNVFDAISHEDRLQTLSEMRRVLSPGGVLMFSAHNRRYRRARFGPRLEYSRNPVTQALNMSTYLRRRMNHARIGGLRRDEPQYALLNDVGHDYGLLHYYIDRDAQRLQLEEMGFALLETFDREGHSLRLSDDDDTASPNLMYVARAGERAS